MKLDSNHQETTITKNINDYHDLRDLVEDFGGIENFRFFDQPDVYCMMTPFGFGLSTSSNHWIECKLEDDSNMGELGSLAYGYKVKIRPLDSRYASRTTYQSDILSMFKSGCLLIKTRDGQHVEKKECYEHICGAAYLHHEWEEVV